MLHWCEHGNTGIEGAPDRVYTDKQSIKNLYIGPGQKQTAEDAPRILPIEDPLRRLDEIRKLGYKRGLFLAILPNTSLSNDMRDA